MARDGRRERLADPRHHSGRRGRPVKEGAYVNVREPWLANP
jgi:hypothetical protein